MCDSPTKCPSCGFDHDRKPGEHWVLLDGGKRVCTHPWHNPNSLARRNKKRAVSRNCKICKSTTHGTQAHQFAIAADERWNRRAALAATSDGFASATIKARLDEYEFVCQMAYEIKRMDWYKRRIDYLNALLTSQEEPK